MVTHERLTEPRVTMEWLLAKPRSSSNLPTFLDLNGIFSNIYENKKFSTMQYRSDERHSQVNTFIKASQSLSDRIFFKGKELFELLVLNMICWAISKIVLYENSVILNRQSNYFRFECKNYEISSLDFRYHFTLWNFHDKSDLSTPIMADNDSWKEK